MQRKAEVVKLDVHFTKDGIPVLSHDGTLKRFLGWDVAIKDKTLQEIKEQGTFLPFGGYEGEKLQTLAEGLAVVKECPEFWIDTKIFTENTLERILAEFDRLGIAHKRIMLATGSVRALEYAKTHFPEIRRVRHIYPQFLPKEGVLEHLLKLKAELELYGMNLPAKAFESGLLTEEILQKLRTSGLWCSIWFVQTEEAAKLYSEMGADAFVTDNIRDVRKFCRTPPATSPKRNMNNIKQEPLKMEEAKHGNGPKVSDSEFYSEIDLELPELKATADAVAKGDFAAAEHSLAEYYRSRRKPRWRVMHWDKPVPEKRPKNYDTTLADNTVKHLLTSVSVPHQFGKRIDWSINPTPLLYPEWTWQLSRHPMWVALKDAYWATGNEIYAKEFNDQMVAWVEDNPVTNDSGNYVWSRWRTIETGIRTLGAWPDCFFGFLGSPEFTDHGIVTMLKSFYEHGCHLRNYPTKGNWLTMEMNGLFNTGALFPEFRKAKEWRDFAMAKLYDEMLIQVYPDGAQTELAPEYHGTSLHCFMGSLETALMNDIPLPTDYLARLEKMYDYYVKIATPDLGMPPVNDSGWGTKVVPTLKTGYEFFPKRETFNYFGSCRASGVKPDFTSVWMPYAGWAIMRTGWEKDDSFLHFDVGPFSTGHSHEDKLSFILDAKGRRLLTEGGVYAYDSSPWRKYVLSSYAHNITLVDGMQQHRASKDGRFNKTDAPLPNVFITNERFDFAEGWYDEGFGPDNDTTVTQYRAIFFIKPQFWVMFDVFTPTDKSPHKYETIFHMDDNDAAVSAHTLAVTGRDETHPRLSIMPARPDGLAVEVVKGQETPVVQGWLHTTGYEMRPIPTPIFRRECAGQFVEPYLLYPLGTGEANPVASLSFAEDTLRVQFADGRVLSIAIKLSGQKISSLTWNGELITIR